MVIRGSSLQDGELIKSLRFIDVANIFPVAILIHRGGKWIYANDAAVKETGYSKEELYNMFFWEMVEPKDQPLIRMFASRRIEESFRDVIKYEINVITKDNIKKPVELIIGMITLEDGRPAGMVIANDITYRRKIEAQLRRSQKLGALGTLASGIAHEFNNYLHKISLCAELIDEKTITSDESRSYISQIKETVNRAYQMIARVLSLGRSKPEELSFISLNRLNTEIKNIVSFFRATLPKYIVVEESYEPFESDSLGLYAKIGQVEQLVLNLLTNARDAVSDNKEGFIRVKTEYASNLETFPLGSDWLIIKVEDNGCGIEPENLERIFDPFFTTKSQLAGNGLGLTVVKNIVRSYKGYVSCESELGKGTLFKVYLPVVSRDEENHFQKDYYRLESLVGYGITVLMAEDDPTVRTLAKKALERCGFKVLTCCDGIELIEKFKECFDEVDLVILDINMPRLSGDKCLEELVKIRKDTPVIITTGYIGNRDIISKIKNFESKIEILNKPFRVTDLIDKIKQMIS